MRALLTMFRGWRSRRRQRREALKAQREQLKELSFHMDLARELRARREREWLSRRGRGPWLPARDHRDRRRFY